ncbi:MAG: zinc ribbon domain-containing protein [Bryobacteraceae bacterium]
METRCTCGAVLPDDARFCHRCGKPQLEEDLARLAEAEAAPALPPAPVQPKPKAANSRISFRNGRAVAVSIVVAALALFGMGFASLLTPLLAPVVLCAAGFISVVIYRSQSAEPLSGSAGARLGWMTGLWLFLVILAILAVVAVYISSSAGRDALRAAPMAMSNPEVAKMLSDPHEFLAAVPLTIVQIFLMITLLPGLGGFLGAKFAKRVRPTS